MSQMILIYGCFHGLEKRDVAIFSLDKASGNSNDPPNFVYEDKHKYDKYIFVDLKIEIDSLYD